VSNDFYASRILPYASIITKLCRAYTNSKEDFEDYYQEVCLQIWRSRDHFKGEAAWSTWVYRLTLNVCLTLLKKEKKSQSLLASEPVVDQAAELGEEENRYSHEALNELHLAIKKLSKIDRAVILLYLEEKPYKEIASILDTNAKNIAVRVQRIKERLRKLMAEPSMK